MGTDSGVNEERLASWVSRLVQIPSVAPEQAGPRASVPGEAAMAAAVQGWFAELGGQVVVEEIAPGRPNVYALWPGRTQRWAAVDVHTDTVGVEQMAGDPFSGALCDGRVWGRGAVDTKASLGMILAVLEHMQRSGQQPEANLLIGATADEEVTATGAPAFAAWIARQGIMVDEMLVAEPTLCRPVIGHKGVLRFELDVEGVSTHSAQPELGRNAIEGAAQIVLAYAEEHATLQAAHAAGPVGRPALTVTLIQGGVGMNVVPDRCTLAVDRRTVPGEAPETTMDELAARARQACPMPVAQRHLLTLDAFWQPPDAPWVQRMAGWSGVAPATVPYGTNAWAYPGVARTCLVMGPGCIDQAHGPEEWVTVAELEKMARIYLQWWGVEP